MKFRASVLRFLSIFGLCLAASAGPNVVYNVSDFTAAPVVTKVRITPATAPAVIGTNIVVGEPMIFTNLSSGTFTVTNMQGTMSYRVEFYSPTTITIVTNVIPDTTGTINAHDYVAAYLLVGVRSFYSTETADARFVLRTNGLSVGQTISNSVFKGTINVPTGAGSGKVLTSDASGNLTLQTPAAGAGITNLNAQTARTQTLVAGTTGSDFAISSASGIHTFNLPTASSTKRGALSSADWTAFNSKESVLSFSAPLSRSGTTVSTPAASSSQNGYLSSANWTTFNGKESVLSFNSPLSRSGNTISLNGSAGGDLTGTYPNPTLAAVGTSGTYTKVTTDSKGRITSGTILTASDIPSLAASKITSGTFATARLGAGTANLTKYLRGDGNWAAVPVTGTTPTGTGFFHGTGGVMDGAAQLVSNADVVSGASIAESKLALNFSTHSNANDPTADQKAALAGTSGSPSTSNRYVTDEDSRNTNARAPTGSAGGDLTGTYPNPTLVATGTAGTYTKLTTDAKGRVTSGTTLSASDVPSLDAAKITTGIFPVVRLAAGGSDTEVQFNNSGSFAGSSDFTFNSTTKALGLKKEIKFSDFNTVQPRLLGFTDGSDMVATTLNLLGDDGANLVQEDALNDSLYFGLTQSGLSYKTLGAGETWYGDSIERFSVDTAGNGIFSESVTAPNVQGDFFRKVEGSIALGFNDGDDTAFFLNAENSAKLVRFSQEIPRIELCHDELYTSGQEITVQTRAGVSDPGLGLVVSGGTSAAGDGAVTDVMINDGGADYEVFDVFTIDTGDSNAEGEVTAVDGSGVITDFTISAAGTGYNIDGPVSVTGGSGSGATVDIIAVNRPTDMGGGTVFVRGGQSHGSGTSTVSIQTYPAGASGIDANSLATMIEVEGNKIGFFGETPAVKPSITETSVDPAITQLQQILIDLGLATDNR